MITNVTYNLNDFEINTNILIVSLSLYLNINEMKYNFILTHYFLISLTKYEKFMRIHI